jgi:ribosomal-protein-alanine N-acetyltransferase
MTLSIKVVESADLPAVAVIERRAFSDPWSEKSFRDALAHPAIYFAGARDDGGELLGYVVAWFVADEGQIANLAVVPTAWGSGVGRALLDAALREAQVRKAEHVYLEVRDSNERARRLYRSRGFEEVGRRRSYYRRPVEDAIVLRCRVEGSGSRVGGSWSRVKG